MLVSFSVANFRSFLDEQTFSMVASKRLAESHPSHIIPLPNSNESVLKTAIIYGANGAGKSNLFRALRYVRSIALRPNKKFQGTRREKFHTSGNDLPSSFDLQFVANNKLYRFGFKVDDSRILEEWLIEIDRGRDKVVYERITNEDGIVKVHANKTLNKNQKISALITIGGPQNQSFLATINATLSPADIGEDLIAVFDWLGETLSMIAPNEVYAPLGHELTKDSSFLKFAGEFLKASATGVDFLATEKKEISEDELKLSLPDHIWKKFSEQLDDREDGEVGVIRIPGGNNLIIEHTNENRFYKISVQASHKRNDKSSFRLDLSEESDGTRRLLDFIPALHRVQKETGIYFIDEIDRSMHPMLVWKFLEFFLNSCTASRSQIIVTTHETNLLDLDLVRRDEIWFAEKDQNLETRIYSLMEFKVRTDLEIRKNYLNGRFGAIPFLGKFSQLELEADC
jgi:AAA15 family ATPase/GTPase